MHFLKLLCASLAALCLAGAVSAAPGEEFKSDQLVVRLKPGVSITSVISTAAPAGAATVIHQPSNLYVVQFPPGFANAAAPALAAHPGILYVEANRIRHTSVTAPNDPSYPSQWALTAIKALQAWNTISPQYLTAATATGNRIQIAVLDTGVDCGHPDFINSGGSSASSARGGQLNTSLSRAFIASTISSTLCTVMDDNGHGTHVAGTIAAAAQNGAGVAGVAWPLVVVSYKVTDNTGSGTDSNIAQAIMAAADAGVHIVSMSLGGAGYSQALQDAVYYAWARNTLVIAAAGNSSTNALTFPAGANYAIGVSATDPNGNFASFSNYGNSVDIAAPGVGILSTAPSYPGAYLAIQNYATLSGTSMATPHVSAVAGLIALTTPGATPAAIAQRLQQTASSAVNGGGWNQNYGYGIVNAAAAVSGTLRAASVGGVTGQVVNAFTLPVTGATVTVAGQTVTTAADGLFRFSNLNAGDYTISATATGQPAAIQNIAIVPGADTPIVLAMNSTNGAFTGQVTANGAGVANAVVEALNGTVAGTAVTDSTGYYSLTVPAGTYQLSASAVGAVASNSNPVTLTASSSVTVNLTIARLGTIYGTVVNSSSQAVSGAAISIAGTAAATSATTDTAGHFQTIGLPAGTYTVTAIASGLTTTTANVTVAANTTAAPTLTMGTPVGTTFTPVRINAGGPAYTDPSGNAWQADAGYTGGSTWAISQNISNTTAAALYQTCRYGAFSYQVAVPNGTYNVKLKFAEVSMSAAGQRVFNASINGTAALSNFDIFAQAGGALIALDKSFAVNVTGGQIAIQFTNGSANLPMVNAIEITQGSAPAVSVTLTPPSVTLASGGQQQFTATVSGSTNTAVTYSLSPQTGSISSTGLYSAPTNITSAQSVVLTATSSADSTKSASAVITLTPPVSSGFTPIRVNAGGSAYTDSASIAWSADTGSTGGATWAVSNPILNTVSPVLYQTCRYGSFTYQYAVPNGTYTVVLKFAEVSFNSAGGRRFNVSINNSPVLTDFDIFAAAGGEFTAIDKSFTVSVTNGQLAIQFSTGAANLPMVNGIDIEQGGTVTSPPFSSIRIDAGGTAFTDTTGNSWSADRNFTSGATWSVANVITNTANPVLYQTCRYGGAFGYTVSVPNGTYNVVLKFAEVSRSSAGQRQFNASINGAQVLTNFDIFAQAGGEFVAIDKTFAVSVTNGQISIQFAAGAADLPMINAIEIDAGS
jgi:subtilisin family serine protease